MTNIIHTPGAKHIVGNTVANTIAFDVVETPLITDPSIVPDINYDYNVDIITPASSKNNAVVSITNGPADNNVVGRSSDENIATIDANLNIEWVSNGPVELYVGSSKYSEKRIRRVMTDTATDPTGDITSPIAGTLAEHVQNAMDALIVGLSPGDLSQRFVLSSNGDVNNPVININPNLFAGGFDFSGMSLMRSDQPADQYALPLVTNRHAVYARHVGAPQIGATVIFKRLDGSYQTAIVSAVQDVTRLLSDGITIARPDLSVVYFDRVITGCKIYKTLPRGFAETYCKSLVEYSTPEGVVLGGAIPILRKARHNLLEGVDSYLQINHLISGSYITEENIPYAPAMGAIANSSKIKEHTVMASMYDWGIKAIPGDSSSPSFMIVNGELVLVCTQYLPGSSDDISFWENDVNSALDSVAGAAPGTYTLTNADLSGFTTF